MDFMQEYEKWLHSPALSPEEHAELESIKDDPKEIESRFFGPLEFGTAGLRGTMYTGLHNMNIHVIRWATQGFADVIAAEGEEGKRRGVAICMDCRNHSMEFARAAAEVCAANGIHVRIFDSLRPTPELSFAVREYGCQAGINVTASHNPKEYNGYKVYWSDGAQLPPHHADAIAKRLEEIDIFDGVKRMDFEEAVKSGLIETMGDETDRKFMANVTAMINDRETVAKVSDTFKLVYTPFHGCGYKLVPEALTALGIKHLIPVPEQMVIDGNFPTVVSPNPENPEGFYLAIDLAKKNDVDFILGTDPDSDRVGIMVRNHEGEFQPVIGNQTADFPAFFCRKSGFGVDYAAQSEAEIASIIHAQRGIGFTAGILVGNPVPEEYALDHEYMERIINVALQAADEANVHGKNITPFLLAKVKELTGGESFETNVQLALNNARCATRIAAALCELKKTE